MIPDDRKKLNMPRIRTQLMLLIVTPAHLNFSLFTSTTTIEFSDFCEMGDEMGELQAHTRAVLTKEVVVVAHS